MQASKMKKVVNFLGDNKWARAPFFWSGFLTIRLMYPVQYLILRELIDCNSVLDLGCGRHSMVPIIPSKIETTGVELFEAHFMEAKAKGRHTHYIHDDILKVRFPDKSFDAVVLLDVIEHLTKTEGLELLERMERWARKKIIVFTPNGFLHQDEFDENPLMAHKSGWDEKEFKRLGFRVHGVRGFKGLKKHSDHDHQGHDQASIDSFSDITQIITYHIPSTAFQLFAVKKIK